MDGSLREEEEEEARVSARAAGLKGGTIPGAEEAWGGNRWGRRQREVSFGHVQCGKPTRHPSRGVR